MWPQPTDYHEAVQHPSFCFKDVELRFGTPILDSLGLPRAILGNFASVYQIHNGSKSYAVRCFLTPQQDREQRYQAISTELTRLRLPFLAGFVFESQGILVKGQWYPILRMDWVSGRPLTAFIQANLSSPQKLISLAAEFLKCVLDLQRQGLAHGDLQHGNILVAPDGSIRFVDYDGMYVPELRRKGSHELGHPNYQHPARDAVRSFGPTMDNFSAWIIIASLIALCFDPSLWFQVHGGDERLLFAKADFSNPAASEIFNTMQSSPFPKIAEVGSQVRRLLILPPDQVPPVSAEVLSGVDIPSTVGIGIGTPPVVPIETTPGGGDLAIGAPGASWVLDHLEPLAATGFAGSLVGARVVVILWLGLSLLVAWATATTLFAEGIGTALSAALFLLLVACLLFDFGHRKEKRKRKERVRTVRDLRSQLRNLERGLNEVGQRKKHAQDGEKKELQELALRVGEATTRENNAVSRVVDEIQSVITRKQKERADTMKKEQEALAAALKRVQDPYIDQMLPTYSLHTASVTGIGDSLNQRLAAAGVRTAADVKDWRIIQVSSGYRNYTKEVVQLKIGGSWRRVDGIGPAKAASLLDWRNRCASSARARAPRQLSQAERSQISQQYDAQRLSLDRQIALAQQQQQQKLAAIRQSADQERQGVERQIAAVKSKYSTQYATINAEIPRLSRDVRTVKWRVAEAQRALSEYRRITGGRYLLAVLGRR
jgi:hypothetical protein